MVIEWHNFYLMFRRRFYIYFMRDKMLQSISHRKGKCKNCSCCRVKILGREFVCRHFDTATKLCSVYNTEKMPKTCYFYPFDEKDKWREYKDRCGFSWDK